MQNISLKSALETLLDSCSCRKFKTKPTSKRADSSGACVPDKRAVAQAKKALKDYKKKVAPTPDEMYSWPRKRALYFKYLGRVWRDGQKKRKQDADYMEFTIGPDGYIEVSYGNIMHRSLNYYFAPIQDVQELITSS